MSHHELAGLRRDTTREGRSIRGVVDSAPNLGPGVGTMPSDQSSSTTQDINSSSIGFENPEKRPGDEDLASYTTFRSLSHDRSQSLRKANSRYHQPLGPQKITLFSSTFDSPLRTASFQDLDAARQNITDLLSDSQPPDATWWLDFENPSEESLYDLCSTFRLHPLTAEDIWRREKRDKFEDFRSYSFVCIQTFRAADGQALPSVVPYTIYVILLPGCTLSFRFTEGEHTTHVLQRIDVLRDHVTINSDWICYALIDDIVDSFAKPISIIERNVSRIDDEVYTTRIDDMSTFLGEIDSERKAIASLMPLLSHKSELLSAFKKHRGELQLANLSEAEIFSRNTGLMLYISDIQDHLATNLSSLAQFESLLARSQESYLAQLSIGNVSGRQRTHIFLKRMGLLTLILALINWLFSMFGMNVNANVTMFAESTLTRFWIIIGVSVFVSVIILAWARRHQLF